MTKKGFYSSLIKIKMIISRSHIEMSQVKKIFTSAGIVSLSTLLSRILGFVRDMVIASFFGAGTSADAFFVAFRIPNLFRRLLAEGSLTTAYVPVFTTILNKKGKKEASLFAESSFRFFSIFLFFFCILGAAASPVIIKLTAPGFFEIPGKAELSIVLTRIMFFYLFFICLVALCMGVLNSLEHFFAPAIAPVFLNISMISSVLLFSSNFAEPVYALAWGVIAGGFVQLLIQFPFLFKKGINPFKGIKLWHGEIKKVTRLMGPTVFGAAVYQISILVNTILASFLQSGSVSYLYYSDRLVQFPLGIFGITAGIVVLPLMSSQVEQKKFDELSKTLTEGLLFIMFITIPASVGLAVLGIPVIKLLFERGEFTAEMTIYTYYALLCYLPSLFAASNLRILISFFYSFKDAKTPVRAGIISFVINIFAAVVLMYFFSFAGLALAVSIGSIANFLILFVKIKSKIKNPDFRVFLKRTFFIASASVFMGAVVYLADFYLKKFIYISKTTLLLGIVCEILIGIIAYFMFCILARLPEVQTFKLLIGRKK
ncbi:MAG: murein biosynthesis integral membrane protein MurJ [Desulfobacteraceae bacterium]|nr:murein biosynthesis integral membrane protein MurJ [Desulfobacteraceae bacterium]